MLKRKFNVKRNKLPCDDTAGILMELFDTNQEAKSNFLQVIFTQPTKPHSDTEQKVKIFVFQLAESIHGDDSTASKVYTK